ncbi:prepilin peptidase [Hyphomicrobium sp.]|uniref:A24 family peptidase n=1 Tax=Hyphomicrobium sp. TaxID=82 RepID=UPI002B8F858E|nr:prepilin peptidase [Hyphomicrobium sp.]HRN87064.1 prepilin peptidase [Hyphomicrobium sp.]HRQ26382.1 prepilin peptidase [Hyphomicrobium sp.]
MYEFEYSLLLVFPAIMAYAGATDLLTMKIPNRISIALVAGFFLLAPLIGLPLSTILIHVAAGLVVLAAAFVLFAIGGFGGGDAKLLAAGALWIGMDGLIMYLVGVTLFGGALALAILLYRKVPCDAYAIPAWAHRLHLPKSGIPYGIAIAASALWVYPKTPWFSAFLA